MEFKGTKGNWHIMEKGFNKHGNPNMIQIYATNSDLEMICEVHNDRILHARSQDFKANANLIASAPELLNALYELIQVKEWKEKYGKDEHYLKAQPTAWKNAQEVIEKALRIPSAS